MKRIVLWALLSAIPIPILAQGIPPRMPVIPISGSFTSVSVNDWRSKISEPAVTKVFLAGGQTIEVSGFRITATPSGVAWWEAFGPVLDSVCGPLAPTPCHYSGPLSQVIAISETP